MISKWSVVSLGLIAVVSAVAAAPEDRDAAELSMRAPKTIAPPASIIQALSRTKENADAIVIPQQNCGSHWTGQVNDPDSEVNPCPENCLRGERNTMATHQSGDTMRYELNYQCYLPEMIVYQPPAALKQSASDAAVRENCGTVWTGWLNDPNADVNPCPRNCERGELRSVDRNNANGNLRYDMNYQCYVAVPSELGPSVDEGLLRRRLPVITDPLEIDDRRPLALASRTLPDELLVVTDRPPILITTEALRMAGRSSAVRPPILIATAALRMTGRGSIERPPILITTEALQMTGRWPAKALPVRERRPR